MSPRKLAIVALAVALPASLAAVIPSATAAPKAPTAAPGDDQFIAVAKGHADYAGLKTDVQAAGGRVVREMPEIDTLVIKAPKAAKSAMAASPHAAGVAVDHLEAVSPPEGRSVGAPRRDVTHVDASGAVAAVTPDPAYSLPGLMWNEQRVHMAEAFGVTTGSADVTVAVADTGLDYTHHELAPKVIGVQNFADPTLCKELFGTSDADLAAQTGGPADGDFNGHGSWIGGNIAGVLDGQGINGIAPSVGLVSLKISEWCGYAFDSEILNAFLYAANNGIDVVSISFGGYLDRNDPDQRVIYNRYVSTVNFARSKGTTIVAAAGNEHLRIDAGGKVVSHGPLTAPDPAAAAAFIDYFGLYETPGGIPGVVNVASTGNVVNAPSAKCKHNQLAAGNETCKPTSDAHQPSGVGAQDQLAYYSNYGPRIDVAGPGGARKFNLPVWDRGGTPGFPVSTADGFAAWEDFSITSNYAFEIPCYIISGNGFPAGQCYTSIQGTSMATPHASAVLALIASARPSLQGDPGALVQALKDSARDVSGNTTPVLSATDKSGGDATGASCTTGYCHLGGPAVSDAEAYGAGIVDAAAAVGAG
jgi:hypothetical protein